MIEATEFFDDFLNYYKKAKSLQEFNEGVIKNVPDVNDLLMEKVKIYNCVERRQAGFSNVLEDIHGTRSPIQNAQLPKLKTNDKLIYRFLHLIHRFTGSGASFEHDHGYRNTIIPTLVNYINNQDNMSQEHLIKECINIILKHKGPTVTSIGNQPPSLKNKEPNKYRLAQHYYFDNFAIEFLQDYCSFLEQYDHSVSIKEAVDYCLSWHKSRGFKQWKFVITAFVMDDAEYYSEDVNPNSHCYFGSNCVKAFELMFTKPIKRMKKQQWHDECMDILIKHTNGQPYSLEDVACDMIRYWTEYIPKKGYGHLHQSQVRNNSILKVDGEYPDHIKDQLIKRIGYYKYEK